MATSITTESGSVGIVEARYFTFAEPPNEMVLVSGRKLGPITLAYETYGELNEDKSNAILICHAFTADAHAAGYHTPKDRKPGWWEDMIGPGKAFDTDRYFVICSNIIAGCKGSTGPASIDPQTGRPYATTFPVVTVKDMVRAQKQLIDYLEIKQLFCVVGGSMGGMQVLQWAVSYPEMVKLAVPIATTSKHAAQAIAFDAVGRQAIMADPDWMDGNYYGVTVPSRGLAVARMVGHITYMSDAAMHDKFGRDMKGSPTWTFETDFEVESYLNYRGDEFVKRFDANSYLYITKAMDYFDLSQPSGSLRKELSAVRSKFLVISFSSDWLYPSYQSREIVTALRRNNVDVSYAEVQTDRGHDAFLVEFEAQTQLITNFMVYSGEAYDGI